MKRAAIDTSMLMRIVLLLVIVWLVLEVLSELLNLAFGLFRFLSPLIAIAIAILIVLWLLDRI